MHDAKFKDIEVKTSSMSNVATNAALNAKINKIKNEIPNITNLATTAAVSNVENKIPDVRNCVKKSDYNPKVSKMDKKYFTTFIYSKFTNNILNAKIKEKNS